MKRFTIFHEAFHILAHCRTTPVFRKRGAIGGSFNELLADYFAVCILMPRQWVGEKWAEVQDFNRMAKIFDVPKPAMCIRLRQLGLI
jgi:Zn-dependent peptidase ImmA (M78 family)